MARKSPLNISKLISEVSRGNERAFAEIFYHYYLGLGKIVFKVTKSRELTEEIVQDSFIKIWLRRDKLGDIDSFENYMHVVVRNETITVLRRIASQKASLLKLEKAMAEDDVVELFDSPVDNYRQLIDDAVSKLPEQQRKVYMMSRYDRLKYSEIAAQLDLSPTTVQKHIQLAVAFIRNHVSRETGLPIVLVLTTLIMP
ncbi:sigma-70 family RNA polymerase sigma factor [Pedobacter panaciterrae]|uniref:Sigma-70 family RNA polymerase sigma factor n=1 Tax=Pedobacter panaciterrae TaxID=363849 RepID=A0ABU8NIK1_9SPHI